MHKRGNHGERGRDEEIRSKELKEGMTMKTSALCVTVCFAQLLTLCALQENLLTTQELDVSMTTSEKLTTNQVVGTKTATTAAMTTTTSSDELFSDQTLPLTLVPEPSGVTASSVEDGSRNAEVSTVHHNLMTLMRPSETPVLINNTRVATEYQETGSDTENTSINIQESTEISTSGTSIQPDHDVLKTSRRRTEDGTSFTYDANTTTGPLIYSTLENAETLTSKSYGTTNHESTASTIAGTYLEMLSSNQTPPDDTVNTDTPTGTSGQTNITAMPVRLAKVTNSSTENTEEPVMSSTKIMGWNTEENTEEPVMSSTKIMGWNTEEPVMSSTKIMGWNTEENTEEPVMSSTKIMDWKMKENTEVLPTTREIIYRNTRNTTWRDGALSTNTEDTWSTNTTTSKNISTSEKETPHWTNCFNKDSSSHPHRFSKLMCFVTMWALGMTASVFLGLSVFLWVRLSITKNTARLKSRGRKDKKAQGPAAKEKESLWAEPDSSPEERVEFWYANGATMEEDTRRHRGRQAKTRKNGERQVGTEEEAWIQPKVTLKDITEFWHTNGRVGHKQETERMKERQRESEGETHRE